MTPDKNLTLRFFPEVEYRDYEEYDRDEEGLARAKKIQCGAKFNYKNVLFWTNN